MGISRPFGLYKKFIWAHRSWSKNWFWNNHYKTITDTTYLVKDQATKGNNVKKDETHTAVPKLYSTDFGVIFEDYPDNQIDNETQQKPADCGHTISFFKKRSMWSSIVN